MPCPSGSAHTGELPPSLTFMAAPRLAFSFLPKCCADAAGTGWLAALDVGALGWRLRCAPQQPES